MFKVFNTLTDTVDGSELRAITTWDVLKNLENDGIKTAIP